MDLDTNISLFACDICGEDHGTEDCPELFQETVVSQQLTKARITLPDNLQCVNSPDGSVAVAAKSCIPVKTKLGPYEARKTTEDLHIEHAFILKLFFKEGSHVTLLTNDENECNWLCLVRTATTAAEQNCMALQIGSAIYYMVTREISVGEEIRVWYAPHYAKKLGRSPQPDGLTKVMLIPEVEHHASSSTASYILEPASMSVSMNSTQGKMSAEQVTVAADTLTGEITLAMSPDGSAQIVTADAGNMVIAEGDSIMLEPEIDTTYMDVTAECVTRPTQKRYRCIQCREDFVSVPLLNQHRFLLHNIRDDSDPKNLYPTRTVNVLGLPLSCKRCGKSYENTKTLAMHVREHLISESGLRRSRGRPKGSGKSAYSRWSRKRRRVTLDKENIQTQDESEAGQDHEDNQELIFRSENPEPDTVQTTETNQSTPGAGSDLVSPATVQQRANQSPDAGDDLIAAFTEEEERESSQDETSISDFLNSVTNGNLGDNVVNTNDKLGINVNKLTDITVNVPVESVNENRTASDIKNTVIEVNFGDEVRDNIDTIIKESNNCQSDMKKATKQNCKNSENSEMKDAETWKKNSTKWKSSEMTNLNPQNSSDRENYCKNCDRTFRRRATFVKHICLVKMIKKELVEPSDNEDSENDGTENNIDDLLQKGSYDRNRSQITKEEEVKSESLNIFKSGPSPRKSRSSRKLFPNVNLETEYGQNQNFVEDTDNIEKSVQKKKASTPKIKGRRKSSRKEVNAIIKTEVKHCPKCNLTFRQDVTMKYHNCTLESDKYHCVTCNKVFEKEMQFTRHVTLHEGTFSCSDCKVVFSTKAELDRHTCNISDESDDNNVNNSGQQRLYHCSNCSQHFENPHDIVSHVLVCDPHGMENIEKPDLTFYSCKICKNVYTSEQALLNHSNKDHKMPTCTMCAAECRSEKALERHMKKHRIIFRCQKCERNFSRKEGLLTHYVNCSPENLKGPDGKDLYFPCSECDKVFETQTTLDDHIAERHVKGPVNCEICGYEFDTLLYLYRHMATHTDQYSCIKCGKSFARNESLLSHYIDCYPEALDGINGGKKYFPCTQCRKVFAKSASLENHLRSHENAFRCEHCSKNFGNSSTLAKHNCSDDFEEGETTGEMYFCQYCGKGFNTQRQFDRHAPIHTGEFTCKLCSKVYSRKSELQRHELQCMANVAMENDGKVKCSVCEAEFEKVKQFVEHYREHTHAYKCKECDRKFLRRMGLENHRCTESKNLVKCSVCNKMFQNESYLENHMKGHNEPNVECSACGKTFNSYKLLLRPHKCLDEDGNEVQVKMRKIGENKYIMTKTEPLICPLCGKIFQSTSNLNKHMVTHGDKNETCKICGKKFHLKANLAVHMDSHEKIGRHQCSKCGKRLKNIHSLHIHMKHMHDNNYKGHPCPECGKTFKQRSNMLKHKLTHLNKRTFHCTACSKSFKCKEHLTRHRIWHEYGERYQCELCKQRFVMKHELTRHEKLYHSGYMYQCPYCKIVCRLPNTMKRHLSRRHEHVDEWKTNTIEFIKKEVIYDEKFKDLPPDVIKQEVGDDTDNDETTVILQAESRDGNPPQTFVIKGNNIQTNQPITQEVAEALQNLSSRGLLESQQNTTISIIGDIQSSSGESIPIAFQSGSTPDSEGYIIVPVVDKTQSEQTIKGIQEVNESFIHENELIAGASTAEEQNLVYNIVSDAKQATSAAQLNTVATHFNQIVENQQVIFGHSQIPNNNQTKLVALDENQLIQSGLNQTELLKALQSNNVQLVIGDSIGGVSSDLGTDTEHSDNIEITMTDTGTI